MIVSVSTLHLPTLHVPTLLLTSNVTGQYNSDYKWKPEHFCAEVLVHNPENVFLELIYVKMFEIYFKIFNNWLWLGRVIVLPYTNICSLRHLFHTSLLYDIFDTLNITDAHILKVNDINVCCSR